MIPELRVTTSQELPGFRIIKSLGIVRGIIVRSRGIGGTFIGQLLTVIGGNNPVFGQLCEDARRDAFEAMLRQAGAIGANAIIGFRYDATELMPGVTEVLAYGTACLVEEVAAA